MGRAASLLLLAVVAASTGCQFFGYHKGQLARRPALLSVHRESGFSPAQMALIEANCPFGAPVMKAEAEAFLGPTSFVFRDGYVLEHSDLDKVPFWVCEKIEKAELSGSAERRDDFFAEPQLEGKPRSEKRDYQGSGFDRGHMAPARNHAESQTLNDETFSLANMSPQVGSGFNQHVWKMLEIKTRNWASERGFAYAITGPLFWDPEEEDPATADGVIEYLSIGPGNVGVPTHFYKIVVRNQQGSDDTWEAIAFVFENRKYKAPHDFSAKIKTIQWVEERSGFDFMPDLNASDQIAIEGTASALWPE